MYTFLVVVQVLVSISLIALVLVQHGKGADAGAAFGSGASGTVFGSRGSANFLTRATAWLATAFFGISLALAYLVHGQSTGASVTDGLPAKTIEAPAPVASEPVVSPAPAPVPEAAVPAMAPEAGASGAPEASPKLPE